MNETEKMKGISNSTAQLNFTHRIYIVESPSSSDFLEDKQEGQTLMSALKLANIEVAHYTVVNRSTLDICLNNIFVEHKVDGGDSFVIPVIHFSMHGNANGIALTSEQTLVTWNELGSCIVKHNKTAIGFLWISMSTCQGFNGCKMAFDLLKCPFFMLIGPKIDIAWTDSLTGFLTFYHHINNKRSGIPDSLAAMNHAAGLPADTFSAVIGKEIQQEYRNYIVSILRKK